MYKKLNPSFKFQLTITYGSNLTVPIPRQIKMRKLKYNSQVLPHSFVSFVHFMIYSVNFFGFYLILFKVNILLVIKSKTNCKNSIYICSSSVSGLPLSICHFQLLL